MLIWQKYLKVLGQVSSTLPSSTSKYQVLLNFKVSSTSKHQVLEILHQVPSTKYKYFTWPQPWTVEGATCQWQGQFIRFNKNVLNFKQVPLSKRGGGGGGGGGGAQSLKKGVNHYTCITPSRCNTVTGPGNISEWNCDQNTAIFIEKMPWKMSSAKWQPFYPRPKLSYLP